MAEENKASQGLSLPDKQVLGFRSCQPLVRESLPSKAGDSAPQPGGAWLTVSSFHHGIHAGLFQLQRGTHELT